MESPDQLFYHGKISRVESEQVLAAFGVEGCFLVRASTSTQGDYSLSLLVRRQVQHFQIKSQGECWYAIDDGPTFEGLSAVCRYYSSKADGLPTFLTKYVPKPPPRNPVGDSDGSLPIHMASLKGVTASLKGTLKPGDINKVNRRGRTPLHEAVRGGQVAAVDMLLGFIVDGTSLVDVNATDDQQWTPLHIAAFIGSKDIALRLLRSGANVMARTADGEYAQNIGARLGFSEVTKLLTYAQTNPPMALLDHPDRAKPWFHGKINRKAAEAILTKNGNTDGLFLVRDSNFAAKDYVLSMSANNQAYHFQIKTMSENCFSIDDGPTFEGLVKIIEYYRTTSDGLPLCIKQYCCTSGSVGQGSTSTLTAASTIARPVKPSARTSSSSAYAQVSSEGVRDSDDEFDYDHVEEIVPPGSQATMKSAPLTIDASEIDLKEELGTGEFGSVMRGEWHRADGHVLSVAVKTLRPESIGKGEQEFIREANVMLRLEHVNVVRLYGVCRSEPMMIVQELVALGALLGYLPKHKAILRHVNLLLFAQQIAAGMVYLEQQRFVHRDLATRNILVSTPRLLKISDFGLSRAIATEENYYKAAAGGKWPVKWYAPESVYYGKFTHKSDVWGYGVTLWEIWTYGQLPYDDMTGREVLELIERKQRLTQPPGCSDEIYQIMKDCWEYRPESRPSFEDLYARLMKLK